MRRLLTLSALLALAACAGTLRHGGETLESRVAGYYRQRQAKNLAGMYPYYSSGYRARVSSSEYATLTRLIRLDLVGFRVTSTAPSARGTDVMMSVEFRVPTADQPVGTEYSETWVQERDGNWYKLDEPPPVGLFEHAPQP